MRIAMISPNFESEKALSIISEHLVKSISKQNVKIDLITYEARNPASLLKKIKEMKRYDIVHMHHEYGLLGYYGIPFFFLLPLIKKNAKKMIVTMHTVFSLKQKFEESKIKTLMRKILYLTQNKLIKKTCDAVHVNEDFLKKTLMEDYGFEEFKVKIIPQGVIDDIKIPDKKTARKELNLSGNVYLIIGNLTEDSGADRVMPYADKIGKTILFVTNPKGANTGKGKKVQDFIKLNQEIIKKNHFEKYVRFDLRELPVNLWWKYISASDLIIQAYRGGLRSGVFSEAMAGKKPVVSSNISFFREMKKKYNSLIIAEKDEDFPKAIKESMNPKKNKELQKECERYIKENGFSNVSKKYVKMYGELLKN